MEENEPLPEARVLSEEEVATRLGVSEDTVRRWRREQELPFFQVGQTILIREVSLAAWLASNEWIVATGGEKKGQKTPYRPEPE